MLRLLHLMGLLVTVYRSGGGDLTNGGISSSHDRLCVVNVGGATAQFEPTDDTPAVLLSKTPMGGPILVPAELVDGRWVEVKNGLGPMAGGNFAASVDSRFSQRVGFYGAVPIHDRFETAEVYNLLTR